MDGKNRDLAKSILKRAMEQGRTDAVRRMHERLKAAREVPEEHKKILFEIQLFGKALPKSPFQANLTLH
ncbi:MAG: hypothetical protein DI551_12285 [Micavibrio aeruginosavorus]|uniref:Uncharacterized protein n=1 Tax=Micavibrio aeruginosavorus TaxID=349221 RepID=A0A2W5PLD0_9BACT|nr:MAG: hypothetical protein DI551_12285 [Micavibrio aeruginosavorus]